MQGQHGTGQERLTSNVEVLPLHGHLSSPPARQVSQLRISGVRIHTCDTCRKFRTRECCAQATSFEHPAALHHYPCHDFARFFTGRKPRGRR